MTLEELRNAVCRYIDENREAYNETGDECYRAVKEELLHILGLIDSVDHEPVGNPDKMTLEELAHELRKIFKFNYLTYNQYGVLCIWAGERPKPENLGDFCFWHFYPERTVSFGSIDTNAKDCVELNLSEYKDADGNIDYSKCIVEVE